MELCLLVCIKDIWNFTDRELERIHNYIQWIFPTDDPRNEQNGKPYVNAEEILKFNEDSVEGIALRNRLLISYVWMMKVYGFDLNLSTKKLTRSDDYYAKTKNWLNNGNHNYLRLTRIISCLKLLGLNDYALELFEMLKSVFEDNSGKIGNTTMNFWKQAIEGQLPRITTKVQSDLLDGLNNIKWS